MTMKQHYDDSANQRDSSVYNEEDIVVDADRASAVDDDRDESSATRGTQRQVVGAAVLGGIAGLIVAGPLIGLVAAGGAAAIATSRGKAGDVARSGGEVVSDAGTRLKKFDEKHHVVEKATKSVVKGCNWVSKKINPQPEARTQTPSRTSA
jgi:hypothetical protein